MSDYIFTTVNAPSVMVETVIDGHLADADVEVLYKRWKPTWPDMIQFSGGVVGITCEAVMLVPVAQLNRVYGKQMGQRIRHAAEVNSNA